MKVANKTVKSERIGTNLKKECPSLQDISKITKHRNPYILVCNSDYHISINTPSLGKTMKKYVLIAVLASLITACGGDGGGSTTSSGNTTSAGVKKRDLVSYMYTDETSQPLVGNGIWNYSVATDYYNNSLNVSNPTKPKLPSLAQDLTNNPQAKVEYVFATFISLSLGFAGNKKLGFIPTIRDECPSDDVVPLVTYYALPEINPTLYPKTPSPLGNCVNGKTATAYYAGIFPDAPLKVVPVAEYADDTFPTFMSSASDQQIINIANALAQAIVSDPSTYGLAIDNEKSINSFNQTMGSNNMTIGQQKEELFFGQLASQLAAGGKYLFLFDAPKSAIDLYKNGNKNVVILAALYDLDNSDPDVASPTPYNPDPITSPYTTSVTSVAKGALNASAGNGQSVMYVVPASATSTIWDYEMAYNIQHPKPGKPYLSPIINTPAIVKNAGGENCGSLIRDPVTDEVITNLINKQYTLSDFYGPDNCYNFKNTTLLVSYLNVALDAITTAKKQSNITANYLGATMYAWRISGSNDINASKNFPSVYTDNGIDTKVVYLPGPPDIQPSSWTAFNTWMTPPNK